MQKSPSNFSPIEGVGLCSEDVSQSKTSMLIKNRRPVSLTQNYCLRPEPLRNSQFFMLFKMNNSSNLSNLNSLIMNQPPDTDHKLTGNDPNSNLTHSIDSQTILNSTAEQTDLLTFVENFSLNSPNFRRPSPRSPMRSRQLGRVSRNNRTRERAAKTRKEGHAHCWKP